MYIDYIVFLRNTTRICSSSPNVGTQKDDFQSQWPRHTHFCKTEGRFLSMFDIDYVSRVNRVVYFVSNQFRLSFVSTESFRWSMDKVCNLSLRFWEILGYLKIIFYIKGNRNYVWAVPVTHAYLFLNKIHKMQKCRSYIRWHFGMTFWKTFNQDFSAIFNQRDF